MRKKRAEARVIAETFDPALWSIATALGAVVVYIAYLI